jgi:hypothetical protein
MKRNTVDYFGVRQQFQIQNQLMLFHSLRPHHKPKIEAPAAAPNHLAIGNIIGLAIVQIF